MTRIRPAGQLQPFGFDSIFATGRRWIWIAAVGAHETVDHELERRWRLVPVDRTHDHDAVRGDPLRIDFVHPVAGLSDRVIGVAGARPMAERLSGGNAGFAGINRTPIFGC